MYQTNHFIKPGSLEEAAQKILMGESTRLKESDEELKLVPFPPSPLADLQNAVVDKFPDSYFPEDIGDGMEVGDAFEIQTGELSYPKDKARDEFAHFVIMAARKLGIEVEVDNYDDDPHEEDSYIIVFEITSLNESTKLKEALEGWEIIYGNLANRLGGEMDEEPPYAIQPGIKSPTYFLDHGVFILEPGDEVTHEALKDIAIAATKDTLEVGTSGDEDLDAILRATATFDDSVHGWTDDELLQHAKKNGLYHGDEQNESTIKEEDYTDAERRFENATNALHSGLEKLSAYGDGDLQTAIELVLDYLDRAPEFYDDLRDRIELDTPA